MMLHTDADHLPAPIREELLHVTTILFEAFAETTKGRCSEHYRAGRILTLILHGPHAEQDWEHVTPGEAFRLLAVVNYSRLARSKRDWRLVRDRLRRAWEFGEIARPVRLSVECLERINHALVEGVPHFVTVAERGIALYQMAGLRLKTPRHLPARERAIRGIAEYVRWHKSGGDFLAGAVFYRDQGNGPMAALLLHQACEHFYLCVLWSITLHGPRTHALDELREAAEALDRNLFAVWPRATRFERRVFGCIRRAYVEARYGRSYRISPQELAWAFGRVEILQESTVWACTDHHAALIADASAPMLPAPTAPPTHHTATTDMADRAPYRAVAGSLEPAHSRWPVPAFAEVHPVGRAPVLRNNRTMPVSGRCGRGVVAGALDLFRADHSPETRRPFGRAGLRRARGHGVGSGRRYCESRRLPDQGQRGHLGGALDRSLSCQGDDLRRFG